MLTSRQKVMETVYSSYLASMPKLLGASTILYGEIQGALGLWDDDMLPLLLEADAMVGGVLQGLLEARASGELQTLLGLTEDAGIDEI